MNVFSQFIGKDQVLEKVIYFTASPLDPGKSSRQSALLNANLILHPDTFEVVRGKYFNKPVYCPNCKSYFSRPEEKKTDVNLSVRMMGDCFNDATDIAVLVSGDTDLIPPIDFIHQYFPEKSVRVYFPPTKFNHALHNICKSVHLENNLQKFLNSQMPETVISEDGTKAYTIPEQWKQAARQSGFYTSSTDSTLASPTK